MLTDNSLMLVTGLTARWCRILVFFTFVEILDDDDDEGEEPSDVEGDV